ncbi:MAG: hypothetical protein E7191_05465 [Erysipelotrichaceae bacterium]|nr:hypothetical protein [Erysipelotrichaceae bacterium]
MIAGTSYCWVIYDLYYMNYVSFSFDCLSIIANLIDIRMILRDRKKKAIT